MKKDSLQQVMRQAYLMPEISTINLQLKSGILQNSVPRETETDPLEPIYD